MNRHFFRILGFSKIESRIWEKLSDPISISSLSRATKIPRTTLYTSINSLLARGFIKIKNKGRESIIHPLSDTDVQELISSEININTSEGDLKIPIAGTSEFRVIHGMQSMIRLWGEIITEYKNSRIKVIQPTKSLITLIKKQKEGYFVPINESIKNNKVIFETITREDSMPEYLNQYKDNKTIQKEILKSFIGRSSDTVQVKNEFLNTNADLMITTKSAFILNWESEVAIEIYNKDMINLLNELFNLARGYGKKIDQTKYLTEMLDQIT